MLIILSKDEVNDIVLQITHDVAPDNPAPMESVEVKRLLPKLLLKRENYPALEMVIDRTPLLKHILWFTIQDVVLTPLGEMVLFIEI